MFRPKHSYFPVRPLFSGPSSRIRKSKNQETSVHKLLRQEVLTCNSHLQFPQTMPSETRESLTQKRRTTKRRITNLVKKIEQLVQKAEPSAFNIVCTDQYLCEIQGLDAQFQQQHLDANALVRPSNQEAIERHLEVVENHDD